MIANLICRIPLGAWLEVTGPDAATFLQGQFTNDLLRTAASGPAAVYGLWLNQKGRVLADSHVLVRGDGTFAILSPASPAATIRERLESYIIADDVAVADVTAGAAAWVIAGATAADAMRQAGWPAPPPESWAELGGAIVLRGRAAGVSNWLVAAPVGAAGETEARLEALAGFDATTPGALAASRIAAGIPEVPAELGPRDLPQEGSLEHEAISFTKGCYLGQEVMARLRSMGQVRRSLFVVRANGAGAPPIVGSPLHVPGRAVGELRAVATEGDGHVGLAMLHRDLVQPGAVLTVGEDGDAILRVEAVAGGRAWA